MTAKSGKVFSSLHCMMYGWLFLELFALLSIYVILYIYPLCTRSSRNRKVSQLASTKLNSLRRINIFQYDLIRFTLWYFCARDGKVLNIITDVYEKYVNPTVPSYINYLLGLNVCCYSIYEQIR